MARMAADAPDALVEAQHFLERGAVVGIPTPLGYHPAADALDEAAVEALREATAIPADRPLGALVAFDDDLRHVAFSTGAVGAPEGAVLRLRPRPWLPDNLLGVAKTVDVLLAGRTWAGRLAQAFGPLAVPPGRGAADASSWGDRLALTIDAGPLEPAAWAPRPARQP